MKTLIITLFAAATISSTGIASATPLAGNADFLDPTNQSVGIIPISGDLDTANGTMTVDRFRSLPSSGTRDR